MTKQTNKPAPKDRGTTIKMGGAVALYVPPANQTPEEAAARAAHEQRIEDGMTSLGATLEPVPGRAEKILENNRAVESMWKKTARHLKHKESDKARAEIRKAQAFVETTIEEHGADAVAVEMVAVVKAMTTALDIDETIERRRAAGKPVLPSEMVEFRRVAQQAHDESQRTLALAVAARDKRKRKLAALRAAPSKGRAITPAMMRKFNALAAEGRKA